METDYKAQRFVDLGLPSGTLWKYKDESGLYTYDQAVSYFGKNLPSKEDLEELKSKCKLSWAGSGYNVKGPNGNSIYLPAVGWRNSSGQSVRLVQERDSICKNQREYNNKGYEMSDL